MADSDDDILKEAKDAFEAAKDAETDNRQTARDDILFARAGDQWPETVRKQRELEGRPVLTINKLSAFVRQVVNDSRQNKPAIKVHPADSQADIKTADVINGLIRNIEYASNADVAYDTGVECAVSGGVGYWRVGLDYAYEDAFEMDISINRISNPFSVYGDPNARAADSSDWDVAHVTDVLTKEQFKREYPKAENTDWNSGDWSGLLGTDWHEEDKVLIAEYWKREHRDVKFSLFRDVRSGQMVVLDEESLKDPDNQMLMQIGLLQFNQERDGKKCFVTQHILNGAEKLKTTPWPGRYIPLVPVYGDEFDIEGKRYFRSLIHGAIDAQRMFNYWRTNATELVALAPRVPFIGPKGAFDTDQARWETANTQSHAYLEYDGAISPQRQPLDTGAAAGSLQEALNASDDIKAIIGMYDASLGARSNETSGRAIMARQREGDVSTFHFIDNLSRAIRHTGRILIDLIPKVYDTPRIIRVIGEDGSQAAQPVNQQAPQMDLKTGQPMQRPQVGPDGQPMMGPDGSPMMETIMAMHDLTVGKYDLTVTTGPSFTTRREEAAYQMTEMIRALPMSAPVLGKHLAKNMDWPGADEIAKELEELTSGQVPPEVQKQIEQGKELIGKLQEENQKLKQDKTDKMAEVEMKKQIGLADIEAQTQITMAKQQADAQAAAMAPAKPPTISINFKDLPPEAQAQALAEAGIEIDAATIAEHQMNVAAMAQPDATIKKSPDGKPMAVNGASEIMAGIQTLAELMAAPSELTVDPVTGRKQARKVLQ